MKEILVGKINGHFSPSLSCFVTGCRCWLLPDSSDGRIKMVRTQMGSHNRSVMVVVYGTPCAIPPRNSNCSSFKISVLSLTRYFSDHHKQSCLGVVAKRRSHCDCQQLSLGYPSHIHLLCCLRYLACLNPLKHNAYLNTMQQFCSYLKENATRLYYNIIWLILFKKIITVYTEKCTKSIKILFGENAQLLNINRWYI
jgi:hypothetical protein